MTLLLLLLAPENALDGIVVHLMEVEDAEEFDAAEESPSCRLLSVSTTSKLKFRRLGQHGNQLFDKDRIRNKRS